MSRLIDEYTKNKSPEDKKEVERRVREMAGTMSELSALMLVLEEMRQEGKKDGGIMRIGFKGGADMATVSGDTRAATAKSANVSPTGNVTTSRDKGPDPVDDRGSSDQNMVQMLVNAGYTPREIRRITNPSAIDKIKNSPINNPLTRSILRTGLYTLNPSLGAIDFRKAMQLKNLYDYTKDQINEPVDEEDMTIGFSKGGRIGLAEGTKKFMFNDVLREPMSELERMSVGNPGTKEMYASEIREMLAQNRDEAKVKIPKKKKKQKPLKIDLEKIKKLIQKAKAREGAADGGIGYLLGE